MMMITDYLEKEDDGKMAPSMRITIVMNWKSGLFYYVTLYKPPYGQRFAIHYAENHLMSHLLLLKSLISSMKN